MACLAPTDQRLPENKSREVLARCCPEALRRKSAWWVPWQIFYLHSTHCGGLGWGVADLALFDEAFFEDTGRVDEAGGTGFHTHAG